MINTKVIRLSGVCLAVAVLLLTCSCTPTKEQQQARFQSEVGGAVGSTLEATEVIGFIGSRKPTSVSSLSDGNTLYVYRDYWGSYQIKRENCDVFLEVNSAGIVVASHAEGPGCYMNY